MSPASKTATPGPPDKLIVCDLSADTTPTARANAVSAAIVAFNTEYGLYPQYVILDDKANAAYLGAYS